ncbi:MAG: DUF4011 domain-containing protein [Desulfobacterales bacterium]|nr:DUF4011 domain-containing protein [Desulfobacterales bacterium]
MPEYILRKGKRPVDKKTKIVNETLERVRRRLLDLTRRNVLLNFRETRRTIRIVDESPEKAFNRLVADGKSLELLPLPEPDENDEADTNADGRRSIQLKLLSTTGKDKESDRNNVEPLKSTHDPNRSTAQNRRRSDNCLQTELVDQPLERRCKNAMRYWRTGIEEAGINFLFIAIGFLEWYEDDHSDVSNRAPLILVPINIERTRLNRKTNCYRYVITYSGEDIETNLSLAEKLDLDCDLILPSLENDSTPEDYFAEVKVTVRQKRRWRVLPDIFIGFFSFAKLRIYKDLDDDSWAATQRFTEHPLVRDILAGREEEGVQDAYLYGQEYDIDEYPGVERIPLILAADGSQLSAIVDVVLNGKSLVIEGPPGTGKSQTISNLIAAALHEDKSILFVAEKKAALEVVRNRLDAHSLGDFCLELHSHKTQKGLLHADLAARLDKRYIDARKLDYKISNFCIERDRLRSYYRLLNTSPGASGETIYEIFGAAERWQGEIEGTPLGFTLENPLQLTREQISASVSTLEEFLRSHSELPSGVIAVWEGFEPEALLPGDERDVRDRLSAIKEETDRYVQNLEGEEANEAIEGTKTIPELRIVGKINTEVFAGRPERWDQELAVVFLDEEVIEALDELSSATTDFSKLSKEAAEVLGDYSESPEEDLGRIEQCARDLDARGFGDLIPEQLQGVLYEISSLRGLLEDITTAVGPITKFFPEPPERLGDFDRYMSLRETCEDAPLDISFQGHPEHALKIVSVLKEKAFEEHQRLDNAFSAQSDYFQLDLLPESVEVRRLGDELRESRSWIKRLFSLRYRRTKKTLRSFLIDRKVFKRHDLVERLYKLAEIQQQIDAYGKNADYQRIFGPLFKGVETDWTRLNSIIEWSQGVAREIGSENGTRLLLSNFSRNTEEIRLSVNKLSPILQSVKSGLTRLNLQFNKDEKLTDVQKEISKIESVANTALDEFSHQERLYAKHIKSIKNAAQAGLAAKRIKDEIETDSRFPSYFGVAYQGLVTDVTAMKHQAAWVKRLKEEGMLKEHLLRWLLEKDTDLRIRAVQSLVDSTKNYLSQLDGFKAWMSQRGSFNVEKWLGVSPEAATLSKLLSKLSACIDKSNHLVAWSDYCQSRLKTNEQGLAIIVHGIEGGTIPENEAVAQFHYALYRSMARQVIQKHRDLADFRRATLDNIRKRIEELDTSIKSLSSQRVAHSISQRLIPLGVSSGYVRDYTDLSLIKHELTKKKRHIPIRQLVRRAGNALQAIKPCFMMSPLSVAQYLAPGRISFDLVLMDEASQLRLEDSLGAIARGKQAVVVGDPKQLPPTTFFERLHENSAGLDERAAAEEVESVLDICQNCFDCRRLRWHYRSEHESLIAFSNNEFYENDLIVFPSPYRRKGGYGVYYSYVENASYKKGRNRVEAEAVANAIARHFKREHELSLGVATFNIEQRDLIHDELERIQKKESWLEKRIKDTEQKKEPFFIKNLENVQGDERDVIFVSTTYGPDRDAGRVYQRFGPINSPTGWRRLNVIVTRARKRLRVFTSMRPSDIHVPPGVSRGVVALRNYLQYAESGKIQDPGVRTDREPGSDFEIGVARTLKQHGYETSYQIGVAGFFIDIGVHHPDREGEFILGIECDGATYHSAKSVRDRDLLRQQILEAKGWRIHRIWSTDWFRNKDKELTNLLKLLQDLVESDRVKVVDTGPKEKPSYLYEPRELYSTQAEPEYAEAGKKPEEEDEDTDKALRDVLLAYRKKRIEPETDDIEKSILSDELLDLFVKRKPTTRHRFLQFPLAVRETIARGQARFLNEIFEVIEEFEA